MDRWYGERLETVCPELSLRNQEPHSNLLMKALPGEGQSDRPAVKMYSIRRTSCEQAVATRT